MKNLAHKLLNTLIYIVLGILAISYTLCIIGIMAGYNNIFEMFQQYEKAYNTTTGRIEIL